MKYEALNLLPPTRPEKSIPSSAIGTYERLGWLCQYKKNGTYSVAYVAPDKRVTFASRHREPHKAWSPQPEASLPYASLPGKGWYVVCSELLHSKVPGIRDVQYVHDILVADGVWLLGETYAQRYSRLLSLFLKDKLGEEDSHWVMPNGLWLAKNKRSGFLKTWDSLTSAEDEGLVFKNPKEPLAPGAGRSVKCRVPHKNFSF